MYYILPERLCYTASGFFALSSWPLLYRFINRSTQHLPKSFSTQSAVTEIFESSVSEPNNVFIFDHHRYALQWLLSPICRLWKGQICQSLTIQQRAAFCVSCCIPGSNQKGNQASQFLFFRVTSKVWTWLFLILSYLSKSQPCWRLCCFVKAGPQSDKRRRCCILSWVSEGCGGNTCEQGPVFTELNHFISVEKDSYSNRGFVLLDKTQQDCLLRACFTGWMLI